MLDSSARIIFFTGSPLSSTLSWSESALSSPLLACFSGKSESNCDKVPRPTAENVTPQWRILPLEQRYLPTGLTQASYAEWLDHEQSLDRDDETSFAGTDVTRTEPTKTEEDLSRFYEHSFAIHQETDLSSSHGLNSNNSSLETTFDASLESDIIDIDNGPEIALVKARLNRSNLSNLNEIPDARHLRSISPQTVTVDLIVGIISVSHPKLILTRRGQYVELVEILVGDETHAGFAINVWLNAAQRPNHKQQQSGIDLEESGLRAQTLRLRPRDIIFARNVALGSFRNQVSGQSLRRGVTTIDLLYRNVLDASDYRGVFRSREIDAKAAHDGKMAKVKKAKDWVANFVGQRPRGLHSRAHIEDSIISLPEDTQ